MFSGASPSFWALTNCMRPTMVHSKQGIELDEVFCTYQARYIGSPSIPCNACRISSQFLRAPTRFFSLSARSSSNIRAFTHVFIDVNRRSRFVVRSRLDNVNVVGTMRKYLEELRLFDDFLDPAALRNAPSELVFLQFYFLLHAVSKSAG